MTEQNQNRLEISGTRVALHFRYNGSGIFQGEITDLRDPILELDITGVSYDMPLPPELKLLKVAHVNVRHSTLDPAVLPNKLVSLSLSNSTIKRSNLEEYLAVKHLHIGDKNVWDEASDFRVYFRKVGMITFASAPSVMVAYSLIPQNVYFVCGTTFTPKEAKFVTRVLPECKGIGLDLQGLPINQVDELYRIRPMLDPALSFFFIRRGHLNIDHGARMDRGKRIIATHQVRGKEKPLYEVKTSGFNKYDVPRISGTAQSDLNDIRYMMLHYFVDELFEEEHIYDDKAKIWGFPGKKFVYHREIVLEDGKPIGRRLLFWTAQNPPDKMVVDRVQVPFGMHVLWSEVESGIRLFNKEDPVPPPPKPVGLRSIVNYRSPTPLSTRHEWPSRPGKQRVHREGSRPMSMPTIQRLNDKFATREVKETVEAVEETLTDLLDQLEYGYNIEEEEEETSGDYSKRHKG